MAKVKFTAIVADMRGSLAGTTFSKNRYSAYTRTKTTPVNPDTPAQQLVRQRFAQLSQAWRGLTAAQRAGWNQTAVNYNRTNVWGDQVPLNGFNLFKQLNQNLLNAGAATINDAPLPSAVQGFTSLSLVADTTTGDITATFAAAIPVGQHALLFATAPLSAGINFAKSQLRQIASLTSAGASPLDFTAQYVAKFGALPPVGSKVFMEMKPILDLTGQAGTTISASAIAI